MTQRFALVPGGPERLGFEPGPGGYSVTLDQYEVERLTTAQLRKSAVVPFPDGTSAAVQLSRVGPRDLFLVFYQGRPTPDTERLLALRVRAGTAALLVFAGLVAVAAVLSFRARLVPFAAVEVGVAVVLAGLAAWRSATAFRVAAFIIFVVGFGSLFYIPVTLGIDPQEFVAPGLLGVFGPLPFIVAAGAAQTIRRRGLRAPWPRPLRLAFGVVLGLVAVSLAIGLAFLPHPHIHRSSSLPAIAWKAHPAKLDAGLRAGCVGVVDDVTLLGARGFASVDGGKTFTPFAPPGAVVLVGCGSRTVAASDGHRVWRSQDHGQTWTEVPFQLGGATVTAVTAGFRSTTVATDKGQVLRADGDEPPVAVPVAAPAGPTALFAPGPLVVAGTGGFLAVDGVVQPLGTSADLVAVGGRNEYVWFAVDAAGDVHGRPLGGHTVPSPGSVSGRIVGIVSDPRGGAIAHGDSLTLVDEDDVLELDRPGAGVVVAAWFGPNLSVALADGTVFDSDWNGGTE